MIYNSKIKAFQDNPKKWNTQVFEREFIGAENSENRRVLACWG
jgi:hypothetical protein